MTLAVNRTVVVAASHVFLIYNIDSTTLSISQSQVYSTNLPQIPCVRAMPIYSANRRNARFPTIDLRS